MLCSGHQIDSQADQQSLRHGMALAQECVALRAGGLPVSARLNSALHELCPACRRVICRCVAGCQLPGQDTDDCEQSTWERLMIAWSHRQFDPDRGTAEAWVRAIARHAAHDIRRRRRREAARRNWCAIEERPAASWPDLLAFAASRDEGERLARALDELHANASEPDWQLFRAVVIDLQSVGHVARALGMTSQRASDRCRRLKERLRRTLGDIA
jgi:RNA polymerase sigma factor (sigma-70 family)